MFCGIIIRVIIQHSQKVDEYKREPCQSDLRTQSPISWNSNKGTGRGWWDAPSRFQKKIHTVLGATHFGQSFTRLFQ